MHYSLHFVSIEVLKGYYKAKRTTLKKVTLLYPKKKWGTSTVGVGSFAWEEEIHVVEYSKMEYRV